MIYKLSYYQLLKKDSVPLSHTVCIVRSTMWFKYDRDWFVCKQAGYIPGHIWTTLYIPAVVTVHSLRSVSNFANSTGFPGLIGTIPPHETGPRPVPSPRLPDPVNSCAGIPLLWMKSDRNGSVTVTGQDFAGMEATLLKPHCSFQCRCWKTLQRIVSVQNGSVNNHLHIYQHKHMERCA